jgi:NADP-dependent 3-hydroxy acid dehydrogenase YdfG
VSVHVALVQGPNLEAPSKFNNAGVSGGGSMVTNSSDEWERTFNICRGGVYNCTRAFLPMLQNAEESHIVNTSSINGFWASVGLRIPHTAYSALRVRSVRRERVAAR